MRNWLKPKYTEAANTDMVLDDPKKFDHVTHYIQVAAYDPEQKNPKDRLTTDGKMLFGVDQKLPRGAILKPIDYQTLKTTCNQRYPAFHVICPDGKEFVAFTTYKALKEQDIGIATRAASPRRTADIKTIYRIEDVNAFDAGIERIDITYPSDVGKLFIDTPLKPETKNSIELTLGDAYQLDGYTNDGFAVFVPAFEGSPEGFSIITNFQGNASLEHMGILPYTESALLSLTPTTEIPSGMRRKL